MNTQINEHGQKEFSYEFRGSCFFGNNQEAIAWLKNINFNDLWEALWNLELVDGLVPEDEVYKIALKNISMGYLDYETIIEIAQWYQVELPDIDLI